MVDVLCMNCSRGNGVAVIVCVVADSGGGAGSVLFLQGVDRMPSPNLRYPYTCVCPGLHHRPPTVRPARHINVSFSHAHVVSEHEAGSEMLPV